MTRFVPAFSSLPWLFAVATFAAGCGGNLGALGQAVVPEACDPAKATCKRSGFDQPLAVGGLLQPEISLSQKGAGAPAVHFEAADESVLSTEAGRLQGRAPGMSALLLVTDDGTVMDMFHVWVKAPTSIELRASRGDSDSAQPISGRVDLLPGETLRLSTTLEGEGQPLNGDVAHEWKLDKPVAALLHEGVANRRRLVATSPGEATLSIHAGDVHTTLHVVVLEGPSAASAHNGSEKSK
jgi:hypothetical protein